MRGITPLVPGSQFDRWVIGPRPCGRSMTRTPSGDRRKLPHDGDRSGRKPRENSPPTNGHLPSFRYSAVKVRRLPFWRRRFPFQTLVARPSLPLHVSPRSRALTTVILSGAKNPRRPWSVPTRHLRPRAPMGAGDATGPLAMSLSKGARGLNAPTWREARLCILRPDDPGVLVVVANPEPDEVSAILDCQCSV